MFKKLGDGELLGSPRVLARADKVSETDIGNIGRRKPFSIPDTFSISHRIGHHEIRSVFGVPSYRAIVQDIMRLIKRPER